MITTEQITIQSIKKVHVANVMSSNRPEHQQHPSAPKKEHAGVDVGSTTTLAQETVGRAPGLVVEEAKQDDEGDANASVHHLHEPQ